MKRNILKWGMLVLALAFAMTVLGASGKSKVPDSILGTWYATLASGETMEISISENAYNIKVNGVDNNKGTIGITKSMGVDWIIFRIEKIFNEKNQWKSKKGQMKYGYVLMGEALMLTVGPYAGTYSKNAASLLPTPVVPVLDRSKVGPNDSVILAYIDPQLVKTVNPSDPSFLQEQLTFFIKVGSSLSSAMVNVKNVGALKQNCQMQIPNGTHTVHIEGGKGIGAQNKFEILPFEVTFDNAVITYKIRLATDEEKRTGGVGLGNEAYTLEEVAQEKLR